MIYQAFQAQADLLASARYSASAWVSLLGAGFTMPKASLDPAGLPSARLLAAAAEQFANTRITHRRPDFGIPTVIVGNETLPVTETAIFSTPFCTLLRFEKPTAVVQPKVLLVAPMSGHFATLLRPTVLTMLPDCDVHITDWQNARDVPLSDGEFGFDDYVEHVIRCLEAMGPGAHVVAVCQPVVAALAAAAVMAEHRNPAQPHSITLMAGPIDARISPTRVNVIAQQKTVEEYRRSSIDRVPWRYPGANRLVYPGFVQLASFMAMNADRHMNAHLSQLRRIFAGDTEGAEAHRKFYDEYFAIADLPAEFYLETVEYVFQKHLLAQGQMKFRGETVNPAAIRRTALLVVEGERDDICGTGQTMAALELCRGIPTTRKSYHLQIGAGHYGVFSGRTWVGQIYPKLRAMIEQSA